LRNLLSIAVAAYPSDILSADVEEAALGYMLERLRGYYHDRGVAGDTVEAVLRSGVTIPRDLDKRIAAVSAFRTLPEAARLAAANKRIRNILTRAGIDIGTGEEAGDLGPDGGVLREPAEIRLAAKLNELAARVGPLAQAGDYVGVLKALSGLAADLDTFFEQVMVMVDDRAVRESRIHLLRSLAGLFLLVADISCLQ